MTTGKNIFALILASFAITALAAPPKYRFQTTRIPSDGFARPGDKIVFTTRLLENGKPVTLPIKAYMHVEGTDTVVKEGNGEVVMETVAPKYGFTYFSASYTPAEAKRPVTAAWSDAVATEPEKIRQGMTEPADFDLFWKQAKAEVLAVPMNPTVKPVRVGDKKYQDKVDCFEIRLDAPGARRSFGYLCLPKNIAGKKLPALIRFDGAGVYRHTPPYDLAADGFLVLSLNAHGIDYGKDATEEQMIETMKKGLYYTARDWDNRKKVPFYHMILRDLRGLEYLKSRPEWNGKHLISYGASQGGAQSLAVTGLSSEITFCYAGVPGLCNNGGGESKQVRGWPGNFSWNEKNRITAGYLDNCNFARRIKCPVITSAAWYDFLSKPSSIYAAYNNISSTREIIPYVHDGHGGAIGKDREYVRKKLMTHVAD